MSFQNANLLIQKFADNYGNLGRTYAALDFVREVSNRNTSVSIDSGDFTAAPGKLRPVRLNYFPILCDGEGSCDVTVCSSGTVIEPGQILFEINECTATPVYAINKDDIRMVDYSRWDFSGVANEIIMSKLPDMRRRLAIDFITKLYTLAGIHLNGYDTIRIQVSNPTTGIINPIGKANIEREFLDGGFSTPYILGGAEVYNWKYMASIGGLNASGFFANRATPDNAWYDDGLSDQILGDTANGGHIIAVAPEVFKFVTYAANAGLFRTGMATIDDIPRLYKDILGGTMNGSFIDPVTGFLWDLDVKFVDCPGQWRFQLRLYWDMFVVPDIACNTQGVNGIMKYRTCPEVVTTCPSGTSPLSPVPSRTFSWTPTLAEIPTITQSVIGGYEYKSNDPILITSLADLAAYMNDAYYKQGIFSVVASTIRYTGYTAISGSFNDGDVSFTFA